MTRGDLLVLGLLAAAQVDVWWRLADGRPAASVLALCWTLPLLVRRRSGTAPALIIAVVVAGESFVSYPAVQSPVVFLALVAAFLVLGLREPTARAIACGSAAFGLSVVMLANDPSGLTASAVAFAAAFTFGPLTAGALVRDRSRRVTELGDEAARLEQARLEDERVAVAEERARIAGELQEVIGRAIDLMTTEADAARSLAEERPEDACVHVEAIEGAGRDALAEARRVLGLLRRDMSEPDRVRVPPEVLA